GTPEGLDLGPAGRSAGSHEENVLTTTAWHAKVVYFAEAGDTGENHKTPALIKEQLADQPGPEDEAGPAELTGPKRGELWITPDTRAATLAPYLDAWRRKVERVGTLNYPTAALTRGVSASPVLEVAVSANGVLEKAVIRTSSGYPDLDAAAIQILKLA